MSSSRYKPDFKMRVVKKIDLYGSISEVSRRYKINYSTLHKWKCDYEKKGAKAFYDGPSQLLDENERLKVEKEKLQKFIRECMRKANQCM